MPPIVVELYTAQGCGSCGAASEHVAGLATDKGVIPLTFAVDYWDYLGWKDTFARPEFADRQRAYDKRFGVAEVFTPQVVVELFTAQGCSSCTAASAHVSGLAADKGVIALTFAVDYWDYLGWKDT